MVGDSGSPKRPLETKDSKDPSRKLGTAKDYFRVIFGCEEKNSQGNKDGSGDYDSGHHRPEKTQASRSPSWRPGRSKSIDSRAAESQPDWSREHGEHSRSQQELEDTAKWRPIGLNLDIDALQQELEDTAKLPPIGLSLDIDALQQELESKPTHND